MVDLNKRIKTVIQLLYVAPLEMKLGAAAFIAYELYEFLKIAREQNAFQNLDKSYADKLVKGSYDTIAPDVNVLFTTNNNRKIVQFQRIIYRLHSIKFVPIMKWVHQQHKIDRLASRCIVCESPTIAMKCTCNPNVYLCDLLECHVQHKAQI